MGQPAPRKYIKFLDGKRKLDKEPSIKQQAKVQKLEKEYKLQQIQDQEEFDRTNKLFDYVNGRD